MNEPLFPLESLESTDARIRALARSLVFDRSAAEDVAQDTWLAALENPPKKRGATNAWLKRVVRNLALFRKRTEDRRRAHEPGGGRPERLASVPEILEREAVRTRLSRAVRALEEPYRTAVLYRYFEDLPPRRIAEVLGITGAAVETRLKRGLQKLRARLDRDFGGDGRAWRAGMLTLTGVAVAPAEAAAAGSSVLTGALIMSAKVKVAIAVVAVAAAALVFWPRGEREDAKAPPVDLPAVHEVDEGTKAPPHPAVVQTEQSTPAAHRPERGATPPAATAAPISLERVAGYVTGTVREEGGRPLAGATVNLITWSGWRNETSRLLHVKTDAHGVYRLGPIARDAVRGGLRLVLEAAAARHYTERRYCRPATVEHFVLGQAGTLAGRVVSVAEGEPGVAAQVAVYRALPRSNPPDASYWSTDDLAPARTVHTDARGGYRLPDLRPGTYRVRIHPEGHPAPRNWLVELEVRSGEETVRDFVVSEGVTLRGRAVDRDTGSPVAGAHVEDSDNPFTRTRADGEGRFELRGIGRGVRVTAPGYDAESVGRGGAAEFERTVRLVRGIVISGRVIGPDGEPVGGARVFSHIAFPQAREEETRTDESGAFRLTGLQEYASRAGNRIQVTADGFAPAARRVLGLKAGGEKKGVEIRLEKGAALAGRVVDENGAPVPDALVVLRSPVPTWVTGYTGEEGRFAFSDVTPGTYDLHVVEQGFMDRYVYSSRRLATVRGITLSGADRQHEEVILRPGAVIAGRVTDTAGRPIPGAVVQASLPTEARLKDGSTQYAERRTFSGEDGSFCIGGLAEDAPVYVVLAKQAGYRRAFCRSVTPGTRGLSLTLARLATIQGRVVMGATGRPAREFSVSLTEIGEPTAGRKPFRAGEAFVVLHGRFTLSAPPGTYRISARAASGQKSRRMSITVGPEGIPGGLELTLEEGATLTGTVLTPAGSPALKGSVAVRALGPTAQRTRGTGASFNEGRFTIQSLAPGTYWLRAACADHPEWDATMEVEVRPGVENRADLQFAPGGRLSVYVKDEARRPVPGATVTVKRPDGIILPLATGKYIKEAWERIRKEGPTAQGTFFPSFLRTGETGSIHPRYLPPGRYLVEVNATGFQTAQRPFRIAAAHLTPVEITLQRAK